MSANDPRNYSAVMGGKPFNDKPNRPAFFAADSWREAAVDLVAAEHLAPRSWPQATRQAVVKLIRLGKTPQEIAALHPSIQIGPVERLRKLIRSARTVSDLIRAADSGTLARSTALFIGLLAATIAIGFQIGMIELRLGPPGAHDDHLIIRSVWQRSPLLNRAY